MLHTSNTYVSGTTHGAGIEPVSYHSRQDNETTRQPGHTENFSIYIYITKIEMFSVCLCVCGLSVTLFGTQKSRDYINCPTGTRSEASEGPTSNVYYKYRTYLT